MVIYIYISNRELFYGDSTGEANNKTTRPSRGILIRSTMPNEASRKCLLNE